MRARLHVLQRPHHCASTWVRSAVAISLTGAIASPAGAVCLPAGAPVTGATVTCTGTDTTGVVALPGSSNVTVQIQPGASVQVTGAAATPALSIRVRDASRITNSGTVTATGVGGGGGAGLSAQGISLSTQVFDNILINAAQAAIFTTGTDTHGMAARGDRNTLVNNGSIATQTGNSRGMVLLSPGGAGDAPNNDDNTLINTGTIATQGPGSHAMFNEQGDRNQLTNSGSITSAGSSASGMRAIGGSNTLTNSGSVATTGTDAIAVFVQGDGNAIVNSGSINTQGANARGVFANTVAGTFTTRIFNQAGGSIISAQAFAVHGLNGQETVQNAGLLSSGGGIAISLGAGTDTLILQTGSVIQGAADGGGGTDSVILQGSGQATNAFQNFETLRMQGVDWTWSGSGAFASTQIENGALRISGTLTSPVSAAAGTTLQIGAGGTSGTVVGNIASNGAVIFNRGDSVSYGGIISGAATLTQQGAGTLSLTGNNTYTGGTLINAGVLSVGADSNLGAAAGGLTLDGGTLRLTGAFTTTRATTLNAGGGTINTAAASNTWAGVLSGAGALNKTGLGTLVLTADNTYTGGTTIAAGTLQIGNGGTTGSIASDITNNSALVFNRLDPVIYNGVISGTGALTQAGTGTLTLTQNHSYIGGTTISAGTLQIGNGGSTGSVAGDILNNASVVFNRADTLTYSGVIGGTGSLAQLGTGVLVLPAAHTYTGATRVQHGTLWVNGSIASATTVAAAGTLGGIGTVFGNVANAGSLAPGNNSIGTLTINGNYLGQGGALLIESVLGNDASPSDKLLIGGGSAAGVTSMRVINLGGAGDLTTGNGIAVVEALNGGTTSPGAFTLAAPIAVGPYEYVLFRGGVSAESAQNWYLRSTAPVVPAPVPGAPEPVPPPQAAPGSPPVQQVAPGQPAVPLYRPEVAVQSAVPAFAGELSLVTLGTFHDRQGEQRLLRGSGTFCAGWGRVFGQSIEQSWTGDVSPEFDGSLVGLQVGADVYGIDRADGNRDRFGVFFGHAEASGDVRGFAVGQVNAPAGQVKLQGNSVGASWTHIGPSAWYVDGVLMHTWLSGDPRSDRGVGTSTDGTAFTASIEGGYPFALGSGWTVEPQAQIVWQRVAIDSTQDAFSAISYDDVDGFIGRVGVRVQNRLNSGGIAWQPWLRANIWHGDSGTNSVVFAATPIDTDRGGTSLEIGGGVAAHVSNTIGVYFNAGYITDISGDRRRSITGNLGLRVTW